MLLAGGVLVNRTLEVTRLLHESPSAGLTSQESPRPYRSLPSMRHVTYRRESFDYGHCKMKAVAQLKDHEPLELILQNDAKSTNV